MIQNLPEFPAITRAGLHTLQANLGYRCNQACHHCHVEAGPKRTEMMSDAVVDALIAALATPGLATLDLTGGAPELHPRFRELVLAGRSAGLEVIDRCNLTILSEPGQTDLARFLAEAGATVVASLPCYLGENVDAQRGNGVFARSLEGLRQLNALGYGVAGSGLRLNLVYNPQGPSLPPEPGALEAAYREHLKANYGIEFTSLLTLTNMPINRFAHALKRDGELDGYLKLLADEYVPGNLEAVMCRSLVSVDWRGNLYDCDFNQMLRIPMAPHYEGMSSTREAEDTAESKAGEVTPTSADTATRTGTDMGTRAVQGPGTGTDMGMATPATLFNTPLDRLADRPIRTASHCFACTAGRGSSCSGALS